MSWRGQWRVVGVRGFVALSVLLAGCGRARPSPATPAAKRAPPSPPASAVRNVDVLDATTNTGVDVFVDASRLTPLLEMGLFAAQHTLPGAREALQQFESTCGFRPIFAVKRLLVSVARPASDHPEASAVIALDRPPTDGLHCIGALVPEAKQATLDGRVALTDGAAWATTAGDLLVLGSSQGETRDALARLGNPDSPGDATRGLLSGAILAGVVRDVPSFPAKHATLRLDGDGQTGQLRVAADFMNEADAVQAERMTMLALARGRQELDSVDERVRLLARQVLEGTTVRRDGVGLVVQASLPSIEGGVATLGTLTALAIYGVRRYVLNAKQAEARNTVATIAKKLATAASEQKAPIRFPPSAPRVPAEIPRGRKVVLDAAAFAHPSWQAIGFSVPDPVYYAYEFVTSKDRRSVTVRAEGDLDGDGETSSFELHLALDPKGVLRVDPSIVEHLPDE